MSNGTERDVMNAIPARGDTLQQIKTPYSTAVSVQIERNLDTVRRRLMDEARIGGEMMYYGWGASQNHIEGASIHLAMSAARCWGNCAVTSEPLQDGGDAWIFTSSFVDLETGFTLQRQFRQAKRSIVHGKHDEERKDDIRFQIGQSKASRNVVLNALPKSIINEAMKAAKAGVRERLEQWINGKGEKGMAMAQDGAMAALLKVGIAEERVLAKMQRPTKGALTLDDLIVLKGDIVAIQEGTDRAEELYPEEQAAGGDDLAEHLGADESPFDAGETESTPEPKEEPADDKPKARKQAARGSKKAGKDETAETPTPNPPEEAETDTGPPAQEVPEIDADYIATLCKGREGPEVMDAVMDFKSRYNRLDEDDKAVGKAQPDWEAIKAGAGHQGVLIVQTVRDYYVAKCAAENFPQDIPQE